jgi:hypothetical protein
MPLIYESIVPEYQRLTVSVYIVYKLKQWPDGLIEMARLGALAGTVSCRFTTKCFSTHPGRLLLASP